MDSSIGRPNQRSRTRRTLLEAASELIRSGHTPTTTEVADAAGVSRRTAYRYFPTQQQLLIEASLERLRPEVEAAIAAVQTLGGVNTDGGADESDVAWALARLEATIRVMHRLTLEYEPLLRTIWRLTADSTPSPGVRPRGSRRVDWITLAVEPLRARLGARSFARLVSALTTCVGFDAEFVLRDLRGLTPGESERTSRWMAEVLVRASVAESALAPKRG